jgi:hypothetical protein
MSVTARCLMLNFLSAAFLAQLHSTAGATAPPTLAEEKREYEILVREKLAGSMSIRIADRADGSTSVSTEAAVTLNFILYSYRYEFHGREVWQGSRLISTENHGIDDGKQFATRATNNPKGSTIEILGKKPAAGPLLAMTTNYWRASDRPKGSQLVLLDADQGTIHTVRVESVTAEEVRIQERMVDCTHFHLVGDLNADLWFDRNRRLVRQQTTEDGYPVTLQLARITTNSQTK